MNNEEIAESIMRGLDNCFYGSNEFQRLIVEALDAKDKEASASRDLIMRDICEAEMSSVEKEDAVNLIYDDLYRIISRSLEVEENE